MSPRCRAAALLAGFVLLAQTAAEEPSRPDRFSAAEHLVEALAADADPDRRRECVLALTRLADPAASRHEARAFAEAVIAAQPDGPYGFHLAAAICARWLEPVAARGETLVPAECIALIDRLHADHPRWRNHWRMIHLVRHRHFLGEDRRREAAYCLHWLRERSSIVVDGPDPAEREWVLSGLRIALVDATLAAEHRSDRRRAADRLLAMLAADPALADQVPAARALIDAAIGPAPSPPDAAAAPVAAAPGTAAAAPLPSSDVAPAASAHRSPAVIAAIGVAVAGLLVLLFVRLRRARSR